MSWKNLAAKNVPSPEISFFGALELSTHSFKNVLATSNAETELSGTDLFSLVKPSLMISKYWLQREMLINSPSTSIATNYSGADAGNSCNGCACRRSWIRVYAQVGHRRRVEL